MGDVITRKCAKCKGEIVIDVDDIRDVIFFNKLYYHQSCFEEMAVQKSTSKRGKPQMWQDAIDSIWEIEAETKRMLDSYAAKEALNMWLLENYDVVEVPKRLFQIVSELELGKYKGKRCKPVRASTLYGCWKWGQQKLNEIARNNKANNRGPADDGARIMYDLAVLVGKVPNYLAYKEKQKAAELERRKHMVMINDVDMSRLGRNKNKNRENINDIFDDIF